MQQGSMKFTPHHDKMIRGFAGKVFRRAAQAGAASLCFEDIYQELCIAWCQARDSWKAEYNVPFGAFLNLGMRQYINRWVQGEIGHGQAASLETLGREGGADGSLHDILPDTGDLQDKTLADEDVKDYVLDRLTPRARLFIRLLDKPPQFLQDAAKARDAHVAYAREQGVSIFMQNGISAAMVLDFMEAGASERGKIYAELAEKSLTFARIGK